MKARNLFGAALLLAVAGLTQPAHAIGSTIATVAWQPGFVIRAEDRFDPVIQRLMAEHSLRSLPLERGRLYYLYPIGVAPRLEGIQIRYLETLLDKQAEMEQRQRGQEDEGDAETGSTEKD